MSCEDCEHFTKGKCTVYIIPFPPPPEGGCRWFERHDRKITEFTKEVPA